MSVKNDGADGQKTRGMKRICVITKIKTAKDYGVSYSSHNYKADQNTKINAPKLSET